MIIQLVHEAVAADPLMESITPPECGAVVNFLGVVRNQHHGRQVLRLEYSAYESMALAKMQQIAAQLKESR